MLRDCVVLDLTDERGLLCGQLLADLGATVLHVEPVGGSPARADPTLWAVHTRNQQSVELDMEQNDGRARFLDLAARCDIVVESGAVKMDSLGLGFESLVAINPSLVYVSISPFGATGPKRDYEATDLIVQASAGSMAITGFTDRPPIRVAGVTAWSHAGAAAAGAALIGLRRARRAVEPSYIDISAQEATALTNAFTVLSEAIGSVRSGRIEPGAGTAIYPCEDGFVANTVGLMGPIQRFLARQLTWLESQSALDPELATAFRSGTATPDQMRELGDVIVALFATQTRQQLLDAALEHGFVLAPVNTTRDVLDARQFKDREVWWHDGELTMPGPFARFSATPISYRNPAPRLGQHQTLELPQRPTPLSRAMSDSLPLKDINVLDFGWVMAGPYATRIMADYGASVIKIESSKRLDLIRLLPPFYRFAAPPENSASFACVNAGKQSLALDLSHPDARQVVLDLVKWADIVCDAFAPGAMVRMGFDYETLRRHKPDIIMLSSSLYGQTGPYSIMPGYGTQGSAMAGLTHGTGYPDRDPIGPAGPFTDFLAPRYHLIALLAALDHRDRTGEGQYIDLSQAEAGLQAIAASVARSSLDGSALDRVANNDPLMRPHGVYPAAGKDEWVAIAVRDENDWRALCKLIDRLDLVAGTPPAEIDSVIAKWTRQRSALEAERILQAAGVPAHHVLNSTTVLSDAGLSDRQMFVMTTYGEHPALVTSTGYHFSGMKPWVGPVPRIGDNSVEVLRDHLHYSNTKVNALADSGVIAS